MSRNCTSRLFGPWIGIFAGLLASCAVAGERPNVPLILFADERPDVVAALKSILAHHPEAAPPRIESSYIGRMSWSSAAATCQRKQDFACTSHAR